MTQRLHYRSAFLFNFIFIRFRQDVSTEMLAESQHENFISSRDAASNIYHPNKDSPLIITHPFDNLRLFSAVAIPLFDFTSPHTNRWESTKITSLSFQKCRSYRWATTGNFHFIRWQEWRKLPAWISLEARKLLLCSNSERIQLERNWMLGDSLNQLRPA